MSQVVLGALVATTRAVPGLWAQATVADSEIRPLSATFTYTGELGGNAAGGVQSGTIVLGVGGAQVTLQLQRLIGWWRGGSVFVFVLGVHGGAPSDLVGDVQGVSNLQAPHRVWLEEVWLQQNLFGSRLSWLLGRYDLNTEFDRLQSAGLFINSSFGIGPEFALSGAAGPSIFPNTSLGTRVAFKPSANSVWRTAVLDAPDNGSGGGIPEFASDGGALLVSEVVLLSRPGTLGDPRYRRFHIGRGAARPYTGKIALGAWYYTGRFPDLTETLPSGKPVPHRGSVGAYLIGDQTLWSAKPGRPGVVSGFLQLGLGDGRVNQVGSYLGGGLTVTAPFSGRTQDQLGLALASAVDGSHYDRAQASAGTPAASETTVELTYLVQLSSWLAIQPDLQYVVHPGGTEATRNALVPGLRVAVSH
jgi:porin